MTRDARSAARPPGLRRAVVALLMALLTVGVGCLLLTPAVAAKSETASTARSSQPLVVLLHDRFARSWPNPRAGKVDFVDGRRPLTGARTVLPVLRYAVKGSWARVQLPGRPNGHTGWIPTSRTKRTFTAWRLSLDLSDRLVTVHLGGRVERRFRAVIGKPSTPTPRGRFFIEEALELSPLDTGGPFALATSARSEVLQEFEGGPGQIALHGTDNLSGSLGTAVSHGCIRLSTGAITWLAMRIGGGVPLIVTR